MPGIIGTLSFKMRSSYACVNCNFSTSLIIFWQSFTWKESFRSSFPSSWHGMKSSTWSHDFAWNRFLVCKLHIRYVTEMIMSSIVSFCQGLSLVQVPTSNHTWKQCCCEVCGGHSLSSGNTVCKKTSTYRELTSWHQEADSCSYQALLFCRSLSLEAVTGEVL